MYTSNGSLTNSVADQSQGFFTTPIQRLRSNDKDLKLRSRSRIDMVVRAVLTCVAVAILTVPSALLYLLPGHSPIKIALIAVFTGMFSLMLGVFTRAKRSIPITQLIGNFLILKLIMDTRHEAFAACVALVHSFQQYMQRIVGSHSNQLRSSCCYSHGSWIWQ